MRYCSGLENNAGIAVPIWNEFNPVVGQPSGWQYLAGAWAGDCFTAFAMTRAGCNDGRLLYGVVLPETSLLFSDNLLV